MNAVILRQRQCGTTCIVIAICNVVVMHIIYSHLLYVIAQCLTHLQRT